MNKNIKSHNSTSIVGATSKSFLIPGVPQFFLYILISALLFIVLNIKHIWDYLNNTVLGPQGGLDKFISEKAPGIHDFLNTLSQSIILQVLFWLCVGCIIYIFIWFVSNVAVNIINDVVADKYVHPKTYNRSSYWSSVLARKVFFWISIVILIFFIGVAMKFLVVLSKICYEETLDFQAGSSLLTFLQCLLSAALLIHIFILLMHTVTNSWRLIYKDL